MPTPNFFGLEPVPLGTLTQQNWLNESNLLSKIYQYVLYIVKNKSIVLNTFILIYINIR